MPSRSPNPGPLYRLPQRHVLETLRGVCGDVERRELTYTETGHRWGLRPTQARAAHAAHCRLSRGLSWNEAAQAAGYPSMRAAVMAVRRLFRAPGGHPRLPEWA